jgi:hypothetical protein
MATQSTTPTPAPEEGQRRRHAAVGILCQSLFSCTPAKASAILDAVALAFGLESVDRRDAGAHAARYVPGREP